MRVNGKYVNLDVKAGYVTFYANSVSWNERRTHIDLKSSYVPDKIFRLDFITNSVLVIVTKADGTEKVKKAKVSEINSIQGNSNDFVCSLLRQPNMERWVVAYFDMLESCSTYGMSYRNYKFKSLRRVFGSHPDYAFPSSVFSVFSPIAEKLAKQGLYDSSKELLFKLRDESLDSIIKMKAVIGEIKENPYDIVSGQSKYNYRSATNLSFFMKIINKLATKDYYASIITEFKKSFTHTMNTEKFLSFVNQMDNVFSSLIEQYQYNPKRLLKYILEDLKWQGITFSGDTYYDRANLQLLYDYAKQSHDLKGNNTFDKYPKYLKTQHDIVSMLYSYKESEINNSKYQQIADGYSKLEEWNHSKYQIVCSKVPNDLIQEGANLNHCVSSYIDDVLNLKSYILFLRKKEDLGKSLLTIELFNKEIKQIRGVNNRNPTQEELKAILMFAKKNEIELSSTFDITKLEMEEEEQLENIA